MRALVVDDLLEAIEKELGEVENHRNDDKFLELCNKIQGKEVELAFIGDDAFEKQDNNYWLPNSCWEEIN